MKTSLAKELPIIITIMLPFIYLAYIWNTLPAQVPIHWNAQGEIDGYAGRISLLLIPFALPVLTYIIFSFIPKLDPKGKIGLMGTKYHNLKLFLVAMMSLLALFIIHSSKKASIGNMNYIFSGLGILFIILGNFMKTIKPNYFLGIRTPWTLENEQVWKETHELAGKLWFIGGLLITILTLLLPKEYGFNLFISITILLALVPIIYSYLRFQKYKSTT